MGTLWQVAIFDHAIKMLLSKNIRS